MTRKEQVLFALSHREPDRVPVMDIFDREIAEQVLGRPSFWRAHFKEIRAYWEGRRDEVVEKPEAGCGGFRQGTGAGRRHGDAGPS
ncbi:MAG TPA: hypothetical protein EYP65_01210 [Armatimonadetes bacterium]|nr:hypothetical protein [Armatimonadota bacterium]